MSDNSKYKNYLNDGDEAARIPRSTLYKYQLHMEMETDEEVEAYGNLPSSNEKKNDFIDQQDENEEHFIVPNVLDTADMERKPEDNISFEDESEKIMENNLREILLEEEEEEEDNSPGLELKRPKNLKEFMESDEFSKRINTPIDKTVEPVLPDSRYLIDKIFNPKSGTDFHAVCHNCTAYIGKFGEIDSFLKSCPTCKSALNLKNPSDTSYFVLTDPSDQISDILHSNENYYDYVVNTRQYEKGYIKDIYDGKLYRRFVSSLPKDDKTNYVTAIFNTDGAPKFKSSQFSIWPMYLMINELPAQLRMMNLIVCGLWFNKKKPEMTTFLEPFVKLMRELLEKGILCIIREQTRSIKLYTLVCCVDSVARAPIQEIKQFNGHFGCNWCLHPGNSAEGSIKYPILPNKVKYRDDESTVNYMHYARSDNVVYGIKYPSPFINLPFFGIISGFVPDYLHCCLEGVAVQFTEYYLASMELNKDDVEELDRIMMNIRLPHQLSRLTRPLSVRHTWKTREWENFVLYTSTPIYLVKLNKKYLNHWLLFVQSLYILLQDNITIKQLDHADALLHEFVALSEDYFGIKAMTFNLHQMIHLSKSVQNWGPLWAQSTFAFESGNYQLLRAIKCAQGVTQQIVRYVNINHSIRIIERRVYPNASDPIKIYCNKILNGRLQNSIKISDITYFGKGKYFNDHNITSNLNLSNSTKVFLRMSKNGCLYGSCRRTANLRSNDSFALLEDGTFIKIVSFIADNHNYEEYTLGHMVHTKYCFNNKYNKLQILEFIDEELAVFSTTDIKNICVILDVFGTLYIIPLPNFLHY